MAGQRTTPRPEPTEQPSVSRGAVWFALVGGGGAWMLHLLLAYAVAEFGCLSGWGEIRIGGLTLVAWVLFGVSLGALTLALGATILALRIRRRFPAVSGSLTEQTRTLAFSGRLALVTNVVFTLVIAVQSVPILYFLRGC